MQPLLFLHLTTATLIFSVSGQKILAQHKLEIRNGTGTLNKTSVYKPPTKPPLLSADETAVKAYLAKIAPELLRRCMVSSEATWAWNTNSSNPVYTEKATEKYTELSSLILEAKNYTSSYAWRSFNNQNIRSQVDAIFRSAAVLDTENANRLRNLQQEFYLEKSTIRAQIEGETEAAEEQDPGDAEFMKKEFKKGKRNWKAIYGPLSKLARPQLEEYFQLLRTLLTESDKELDEEDWFLDHVHDELVTLEGIWKKLTPLYVQFHAHIRGNLKNMFGSKFVPMEEAIPVQAITLFDPPSAVYSTYLDTIPVYGATTTEDVALRLTQRNMTTEAIYRLVEEYFDSMGFPKVSPRFWNESMFELPDDLSSISCDDTVDPICYQGESRLIECNGLRFDIIPKAHSALGLAKCFQLMKKMEFVPLVEIDEVLTDALTGMWKLTGSSPKRLQAMGLIGGRKGKSSSVKLNFLHWQAFGLYSMAGLLSEQKVFWAIFDGKIPPQDYNCQYWKERVNIEGVRPPVKVNSSDFEGISMLDFKSEGKVDKLVSHVLTFQFYKALCNLTVTAKNGRNRKLRDCDLTGNKIVGLRIGEMLESGAGKDWRLALKFLTGNDVLDPEPMLEYFKPYHDWLLNFNKKMGFKTGWKTVTDKTLNTICE